VSTAIWHDIECGAYTADLPLWEELAGGGRVLDVGAGTGPLYALPTYTALLELRDLLAARGDVKGHWR